MSKIGKAFSYLKHGYFRAFFRGLKYVSCKSDKKIRKSGITNEAFMNDMMELLRKRYRKKLVQYKIKAENEAKNSNHIKSKIIWICWLQGIENAPPIVKICYQSIIDHFGKDYKINLITLQNYKEYIKLPNFIEKKFEKGYMLAAHFSDVIRTELLIKYGGTWIDSTILCTGKDEFTSSYFDSDFFVYRFLFPFNICANSNENWFITSCANHKVMIVLRELLYDFWARHNYTPVYLIYYLFLEILTFEYPEIWKDMDLGVNVNALLLQTKLFDKYDKKIFSQIIHLSCFHKLSYKINDEQKEKDCTFYQYILSNYKTYGENI